jgi:hypothetical protein
MIISSPGLSGDAAEDAPVSDRFLALPVPLLLQCRGDALQTSRLLQRRLALPARDLNFGLNTQPRECERSRHVLRPVGCRLLTNHHDVKESF